MKTPEPFFRGWFKPGPIPPGAISGQPPLEPGETLDAISGHFRLFQLETGHRFSTDDVLAAWYGTIWCPCPRSALDLGSGLGTVAMIAAWRLPGTRFVAVEAQPDSLRLARKSARWNGLEDRLDIREGDFREPGVLKPQERFDLILGSPPYFPEGTGVTGDHDQKVACRFELRGSIADYCATASKHLEPGGLFACVFPITPETQHQRVQAAAANSGLTIVRRRPVVLREGNPPLLGLFGMMLSDALPDWMRPLCWVEPPLVIRCLDGRVHPEYSAVKLAFGFPP